MARAAMAWIRTPVLAPFLRQRKLCFALGIVASVLVVARGFGLGLWICPFEQAFGIRCAGCGMTRAAGCLLRGDLAGALAFNALSPLVFGVGVLALLTLVLPARSRDALIGWIERAERKTAAGFIFVVAALIYMLTRNVSFW